MKHSAPLLPLICLLSGPIPNLRAAEPPPPDEVKFAGLSGEAAVEAITLPSNFKAHLFATEPDVRQPIAMALDPRGRLWIAEAFTYPKRAPEGQGKDRIVIFEDADRDHRSDRRTIFAEGLNLISGLEVGFGGVWVGAAPHLMFIPDRNGDDKPDGPPEILLDGWDFAADTHETLNTFTWGPDGWLYGCHGVFCPSHVGKPGTPLDQRQRVDAGIWRYHPTQHKLEVFAEGTSNPWGMDFNAHGQLIMEACVIPHLWHMIQGGRYERQGGVHYSINAEERARVAKFIPPNSPKHVNPFIYEDLKTIADHAHYAGDRGPHAANFRSDSAGGGHAHSGLMVYLGDSWPDTYRGRAFMNNILGQRINQDIIEPRGSGFVGRHAPDFLNFHDKWSQVINLRYDHDGSVFLIDWYDANQCHHNILDGHDRSNGRIYKVVYGDTRSTPINLKDLSDDELVRLQLHANEWHVRQARRLLQERGGSPKVHQALEKILVDDPNEVHKLRALWTLHVTGGLAERRALALLDSDNSFVRGWTIQLLAEKNGLSPAALSKLAQMARSEPSPFVRLYIVAALQCTPPNTRWEILAGLASRNEDATDHNLPLMTWFAAEPLIEEDPARALDLAAASALPRTLALTTRRIAALATPEAFAVLVKKLSAITDEPRQLEMLKSLSQALAGQRGVRMPEGWPAAAAKLRASGNPNIRLATQNLALRFGSPEAPDELKALVLDRAAGREVRAGALEALLSTKPSDLAGMLQKLLDDPELRSPAIRGLAAYDDPKTPAALLQLYPSLEPAQRREVLNALASRTTFAKHLLDAINAATVQKADLTADLIRQLRSLKNPELDQTIATIWGAFSESSEDKQQLIRKYRRVYGSGGSLPGDPARGRVVYARVCQQCHVLFGEGGKVGPDITGSNRRDLDYIIQNMVDPNAVIPNEYRSSLIETKDGRVITAIVRDQDANAVTALTATETLVIPRSDIQLLKQSDVSMMPEGLLDTLSDREVRDLIYYLGQPGQVPMAAAQ